MNQSEIYVWKIMNDCQLEPGRNIWYAVAGLLVWNFYGEQLFKMWFDFDINTEIVKSIFVGDRGHNIMWSIFWMVTSWRLLAEME